MKRTTPKPSSSSSSSTASASSNPERINDSEPEDDNANNVNNENLAEQIADLKTIIANLMSAANLKSNSASNLESDSTNEQPEYLSGMQCSRKEYVATSTSVAQIFKSHAITNTTIDSFKRINVIKGAISTAGLMTLLEGHRQKPIETADNEFGYSRRRKILVDFINDKGTKDQKYVYLENDDTYLYTFDNGRLFQAMMDIFDENLHYLVSPEIINSDGRGMYVKIMAHLNGQRSKDADKARYALDNFKINESVTFKTEHARFTDLMRHLEYCQIRDMTPEEKMAFLTRNILFDSRLGMKECMVSSKMLGLSYDNTIQKLIEINMEMPDSLQVVKLKNMSEIQYCHAFNNGHCKFGESCRYIHKINPNHVKREVKNNNTPNTYNKSKNNNFSNGKENNNRAKKSNPPAPIPSPSTKPPVISTPVTKSNRTVEKQNSSIPRGIKSETNPQGWSNSQKLAIKMMEDSTSFKSMKVINIDQSSDIINNIPQNSSTSFSSWGEISEMPFKPATCTTNEIRLNMMSSTIDSSHKTLSIERSKLIKKIQQYQMEHGRRTHGLEKRYPESVHCLPRLSQERFFNTNTVTLGKVDCITTQYDDDSTTSNFVGFGWNRFSANSGRIKEEIRNPTGSLMELIYRTNEIFLGAKINNAIPIKKVSRSHAGSFDINRYMTFNGKHSAYFYDSPGSYKTSITSINIYTQILKRVKTEYLVIEDEILVTEQTLDLMLWCICYDFMAYCSQKYGEAMENNNISITNSRKSLTREIRLFSKDEFVFDGVKDCFISIASGSRGSATEHGDSGYYGSSDPESENDIPSSDESQSESETEYDEPRRNTRRKCNVMSIYSNKSKQHSTQRKYHYTSAYTKPVIKTEDVSHN